MIATNNLPSAGSAQIDKDFDKIRILDVSYPAVGGKEYSITPAQLGSAIDAYGGGEAGTNTPSGINLGTGASIYKETTAGSMQFKTLLPGLGINLSTDASTITFTASAGGGTSTPSGINLGTGASIYRETTAGSMQFKTLLPGAGINLSVDASTISFTASAAGSLPNLTDITITSPAGSNVLSYNSAGSFWENKDVAALSFINNASALAEPSSGLDYVLVYNSATSQNRKVLLSNLFESKGPVVAVCSSSAGNSLAHNAVTIIDFETVAVDTHNAVTTGSGWHFTAPLDGHYQVQCFVRLDSSAEWAPGESFQLRAYIDGTPDRFLAYEAGHAGGANFLVSGGGPAVVSLTAGQALDVRGYQNSGSAQTISAGTNVAFINIFRIH